MPRVDRDHRHAGPLRLVLQERPQLSETPGVQIVALRSPNRYPLANVRQVFDSNPAPGAFRFIDNLFTHLVVYVPCEAFLSARQETQSPLGAARLFGLESSTLTATALAHA